MRLVFILYVLFFHFLSMVSSLRCRGNILKAIATASSALLFSCGELQFAGLPPTRAMAVNFNYQSAHSLVESGMASFRAGKVEESVKLFHEAIDVDPRLRPYMWQLGISEYFTGDYSACSQQFRNDVKVNPDDTEEILWAFLCDVGSSGKGSESIEQARMDMMHLSAPDPRGIMRTVYNVFEGTQNDDALFAVGDASGGKSSLRGDYFYSRLYLALLADARGDAEAASRIIRDALDSAYAISSKDYMVQVARVQLQLTRNENEKSK